MKPDDLGLNVQDMIAGFAGGVVHAFAFRPTDPVAQVGSVILGTLTANYLGPEVAHYVGGWISNGAAAFLVGMSAMAIVQVGVAAVESQMGRLRGGNDGGKS